MEWYPPPAHPTIIEPFAGSASYAMRYWKRAVLLIEKDPRIIALWKWLIEEATRESILAMPDLVVGEQTDNFLHILYMASKMGFTYHKATVTPLMAKGWWYGKRQMAKNVHKVKHWKIIEGDYTQAPDIPATWFIDPPTRVNPVQATTLEAPRLTTLPWHNGALLGKAN